MAERKPIGKKMRFEVFKRDKFTCQYCGRKAPDVILEVDHINESGDAKQVEQVNTDRQPDEESDQDDPTAAMGLVSHLFPFQDGPEGDCGEKR